MPYEGDNMINVKRTNRSAAIRILHEKGAMSRKRLAENMKLTPAAITKIVGEMQSEGLLVEGETVPSANAGRREINIELDYRRYCALGVLINVQQMIVSAVWMDGTVIFSKKVPIETPAPAEKTVEILSSELMKLTEEHGIGRENILGLGVAVRGITSADGRYVVSSFGALQEKDYPLCEKFEEATGLHTRMTNNVRALFAAQLFLARDVQEEESQFFLRCEYGIGAAMSIDSRIWPGVSQQCAEIGHIPIIRRGGKLCSCGKSGCLETIASPTAIIEDTAAIFSEKNTPVLWKLCKNKKTEDIDMDDIMNAALGGDEVVAEIVDTAVKTLGSALKSVIYLVDPGKIVLYGRLFENNYYLSRLLSDMHEGVDLRHSVVIEKSPYNHQLEEKAASLLVVEEFFKNGGIQ